MATSYILLALLIGLGIAEGKLWGQCLNNNDCTSVSLLGDPSQECVDYICQCKSSVEMQYDSHSLKPECGKPSQGQCNELSCGKYASCQDISNSSRKGCVCNEGYLRVGDTCAKAHPMELLKPCGVMYNGSVHSCDLKEHQYCSNGKCICVDTYFANTTSGNCEPKKVYLAKFNLTEYKVMPGEYCTEDRHCITGLNCKSFECSCPLPCTYDSKEVACDCGIIARAAAPVGPILLGVFLGLIIVLFWGFMIRRTYRKLATKNSAGFDNLVETTQNSPHHSSIALSPISPTTTSSGLSGPPPVGLTVPSPIAGGRQSPVSGGDSLPYKPGGDPSGPFAPPPPPQSSVYVINPTNPDAPPSYSEAPSATDLPPPYSINPPPVDGPSAPLPYPSNPSDSTSALPYPSSPSAPYPVNTYGAPSALPKQEPENNGSQVPYNPSYP